VWGPCDFKNFEVSALLFQIPISNKGYDLPGLFGKPWTFLVENNEI